ncbi:uncharacterized protein PV06_03657 [Exophiala oligosperma]|uniref:Uncharacterized protein n=1 Tax=Exophiala oligosperma TaxID=215243 RepID=A0A0D2DS25_9EURO|nr:uncharacterized protein PV06_03657 [Exophiala oligosperma]KIW45255.1 hypothetical protein PV06_03657 [Exophiala oligosperma]
MPIQHACATDAWVAGSRLTLADSASVMRKESEMRCSRRRASHYALVALAFSPGTVLGQPPSQKVKGVSPESGVISTLVESMRRTNEQLETHSLGVNGPMEGLGAKPMDDRQIIRREGQK